MPNFLIDEDTDLLAAEFVLGTLDAEERANAQSLLRGDHGFIAMVRIWERRLSELHLMVEPVDPDAKILERIKTKLAQTPQGEPAFGSRPPVEPPPIPDAGKAPKSVTTPELATISELAKGLDPVKPREATSEQIAPGSLPDVPVVVSATSDVAAPPVPTETTDKEAPKPTDVPPDAVSEVKSAEEGQLTADMRLAESVVPEPGSVEAVPVPPPASPSLPDLPAPKRQEVTVRMIRSRARWRAFSIILLLMVASPAALIAAWKIAPERVPAALHPSQLMSFIGIATTPSSPSGGARQIPPRGQFDE